MIKKCLSTISSTQLSEVTLRVSNMSPYRLTGVDLMLWDYLDIVLYDLAGKYRSRYEGDKMLVELVDIYPGGSEAERFLWRYRERGTWRVILEP